MTEPAAPQNTNSTIYVVTYIDIQQNSLNSGIALVQRYREATRAEKGALNVEVAQESGRPNRFAILELWKDEEAFETHEKAGRTTQFRSELKAIHNSPYDQRVHRGLAMDARPLVAGRGILSVVTHVDVPPPRREETEVLLRRSAEDSRKEDGNVRYDVFQQTAPRTNHFTVFVEWKDRKAFEVHEMKSQTRQFREGLASMLGAPYDERLYKILD